MQRYKSRLISFCGFGSCDREAKTRDYSMVVDFGNTDCFLNYMCILKALGELETGNSTSSHSLEIPAA